MIIARFEGLGKIGDVEAGLAPADLL